jgi:tetratricopeptide (TPR) repeat protein
MNRQQKKRMELKLGRWLTTFSAVGMITLVACSSGDGSDSDEADMTPETSEVTATGGPEPTAIPEPATPTPEPTSTPEPPSTNENVRNYARAHSYLNRGDYVQAERQFSVVIEIEPQFARGWEGRASALMAQGKSAEAIEDFDRAIQLKPDLASAYAGRAVASMVVGDILGANQDAVQARILDPSDPNSVIVLGRILSGAGRAADALEMFNEGVELAPDEGPAYWWRGRFLFQIGSYDLALADLNLAIEYSPVSAQPYLDRATLYMDVFEEFDLARADIEEAHSLGEEPRDRDILDESDALLERLEQLIATAASELAG